MTRKGSGIIGRKLALICTVGGMGLVAPTVVGTTAASALLPGHHTVAYVAPGDPNGYTDAISNEANITDVSTFSYYTTGSETIKNEYPTPIDCASAASLQGANVRVEALITKSDGSGWDRSAAESVINHSSTRATFVRNVVAKMKNPGCSNGIKFNGAELDLENLVGSDRAGFSATVMTLATALHNAGLYSFVSVYPKSSDLPAGYGTQDAQDWKVIGSVSDGMRIQGYGWCWETGCVGGNPPGALDPTYQDDATVNYATSVMSPSLVALMMPLYGIGWTGSDNAVDVTYQSDSVTATDSHGVKEDVTDQISHYGGSLTFVSTSGGNSIQSNFFAYTDSRGGSHQTWINNASTIGDKIAIAKNHGIGGIGFWRLGAEDPGTWTQVANNW